MRDLRVLDAYRMTAIELRLYGERGGADGGVFQMTGPKGRVLRVIASTGEGWDHVSVSMPDRCPTWEEMEFIKRRFFRDDETAMQLHVPPADHLNCHPYCLHLWRPQNADIPRPPPIMVAPPSLQGVG